MRLVLGEKVGFADLFGPSPRVSLRYNLWDSLWDDLRDGLRGSMLRRIRELFRRSG